MLDVKKLFTKLLKMISSFLVVEEMSKSYTVSANTVQAVDFTPSKTGYDFLGVVGYSTNHGSVVLQQVRKINSTTVRMSVRNLTSSSISTTAYVYVLFVKLGGGYFVNVIMSTIARLAERWWRYVRREEVAYKSACRFIKHIPWSIKYIYKLRNCIKHYSNEKRMACGGGDIKLQHWCVSCCKDPNRQQHHRGGSWNHRHWQFAFLRCASKSRNYIYNKQISLQRKFDNTLLLVTERGCIAC